MYTSTAAIILDAVVLGILLIALFSGRRKGLFRTLMWFAVLAVSLFGSLYAANRISAPLEEKLYPKFEEKLEQAVESFSKSLEEIKLEEFSKEELGIGSVLPEAKEKLELTNDEFKKLLESEGFSKIVRELEGFGLSREQIKTKMGEILSKADVSTAGVRDSLKAYAAESVHALLKNMIRVILTVVIFLISFSLLGILVDKCGGVIHKLPLIGGLDKLGGAAIGLLIGMVLVFLLLFVGGHLKIEGYAETVSKTVLTQLAVYYNPIILFFA